MTIEKYAEAVKVTATTIYNDIDAGRIAITLIRGDVRPVYDIDIHKHPIASYKKRNAGRPRKSKLA